MSPYSFIFSKERKTSPDTSAVMKSQARVKAQAAQEVLALQAELEAGLDETTAALSSWYHSPPCPCGLPAQLAHGKQIGSLSGCATRGA